MMRQSDEQIEGARYPFHRIKGVWGFAPCLPRALALWRPNDRIANAAGMAHAFYPRPDGLANSFWLRARPDSQIAGAIRHAFAARAFCARYPFHRIKGVWGFAPCSPGPLPFGARTTGWQTQPDVHALSAPSGWACKLLLAPRSASFPNSRSRLPRICRTGFLLPLSFP